MRPFELLEPRTMREAAALLEAEQAAARPIAGGTAVMLMMKMGVLRPARLVSLRAVEERYRAIELAAGGGLRVGALATLAALERSDLVRREVPVLARALRTLANVRVRNVATLGGHLAHGDPHMDLPPLLLALGARLATLGPSGSRELAISDLYSGYLETTLAPGELIAEVLVPAQGARRAAYLKQTTRSADDWPALGIAAVLETEDGVVREARIVLGAATDAPTRLVAAEAALEGTRAEEPALRRAGEAAAASVELIGDQHGSAAYKRELLRAGVARAVRAALATGGQGG
jgi:carbon-monoxide dehydrogenase medium subunit